MSHRNTKTSFHQHPSISVSAKTSRTSHYSNGHIGRKSSTRISRTNVGDTLSQQSVQTMNNLAGEAKAKQELKRSLAEFQGLFVHEIIERQLFQKNESRQNRQQETKSTQAFVSGRDAHGHGPHGHHHHSLRHSHEAGTLTTAEEESHMNPMLRRLSKKRRKKILKQQEEAPMDARKQEELILLEMAPHQQIEYIAKSTHFTTAEVRDLQKLFRSMTLAYGTPGDMNRGLFRIFFMQVLGVTDSVMLDQIFNYWDAGGEGSISVTEFLSNLSIILRGTLEEHIKFCYAVYDLNGDGGIGRQEVMALILHTLQAPLDEDDDMGDSIRDMANMIMTQLDAEGTGQITIESFREGVLKDPLSLQILGPCLPSERKVRAFLALMIWDYNDFAKNYSLAANPSYSLERLRYSSTDDTTGRAKKETALFYLRK